jgi:hypothetical protein
MNPDDKIEIAKIVIQFTNTASQNTNALHGLIVTIILALIGWGISIWLQQRNLKQQQQAKINYDIYSQLVTAHKELQDAIASFSASTSAPLILMSAELIPLEIRQQFGDRALTPVVTEAECLHKGRVKYSDWVYNNLLEKDSEYFKKLSAFMYLTEDWTAPLASVEKALSVLRTEIQRQNLVMITHKDELQFYALRHGDDWREWNNDDVYNQGRAITNAVFTISSYIHDLMVIIHNELLAPYYGHKRKVRKTLDDSFQVLTKEGLVTRIEDDSDIRANAEAIIR